MFEQPIKEYSIQSKRNFVRKQRFQNLFWRQDFEEKFGHPPPEEWWYRKVPKKRRGKVVGWDWLKIKNHAPVFFYRCIERQKTQAVIRVKTSNGGFFIATIYWRVYGSFGEGILMTDTLIKLVTGDIKTFAAHPNVHFKEVNNSLTT